MTAPARRRRPSPKGCAAAGCDRKHSALGWCKGHYVRVVRHGDPYADVPLGGLPKRLALKIVCPCGLPFAPPTAPGRRAWCKPCAARRFAEFKARRTAGSTA